MRKKTLHDAIAEVKAQITARQVCELYNIHINGHNKAHCVWHNDEQPSMHIYADGVHCFSCGASGSVVDLCMAIHNESLRDATQRLIRDFRIDCEIDGNARLKQCSPPPPDYKRLYEKELKEHIEDCKDLERLCELVIGGHSEEVWAHIGDLEARLFKARKGA